MIAKPSEIFWRVVDWYQITRFKEQISFWIIFAVAIYLPFEEFVLRWLPLPSLIILFLRFFHELVLYYLWAKVFYKRIVRGDRLIKSSIELALICFVFWAIILLIVHQASIVAGLNNLRTLIRYVAVYYLIVDLYLSKQQVQLLLKTILVLGLIQGYLATIQYFAPPSFNSLFVPRDVNISAGGLVIEKGSEVSAGVLKSGAVNGTFPNTANTSAFLIACFIILLAWATRKNFDLASGKTKTLLNFGIMYFAIFATFKRLALLFALLSPLIILFLWGKKLWAGKIIWLYLFGLFGLVFFSMFFLNVDTAIDGWAIREGADFDLLGYFGQLFSPEYWNKGTRQWIIKTVVRGTIGTGNWFGLSPSPHEAILTLSELLPTQKSVILEREFWFEDVYWGTMLVYYGIPGVTLFGYIFYRLYKTSQWLSDRCFDSSSKALGIGFSTLIIITIFYAFVERIFEIKCYSFYFWLLAGMVVNVYNRDSRQLKG